MIYQIVDKGTDDYYEEVYYSTTDYDKALKIKDILQQNNPEFQEFTINTVHAQDDVEPIFTYIFMVRDDQLTSHNVEVGDWYTSENLYDEFDPGLKHYVVRASNYDEAYRGLLKLRGL